MALRYSYKTQGFSDAKNATSVEVSVVYPPHLQTPKLGNQQMGLVVVDWIGRVGSTLIIHLLIAKGLDVESAVSNVVASVEGGVVINEKIDHPQHYGSEAKKRRYGMSEAVDHPAHYGGGDNPYEAIKVIEAWGLGFCLGNVVKYVSRAGKKGDSVEDLKKAAWYLQREIERGER